MRYFSLLIILTLVLQGCNSTSTKPSSHTYTPRKEAALLERSQAYYRSARVSDVNYVLALNLPAENVPFSGKAKIRFTLNDASQPLTLDFVDGDVSQISVNGTLIPTQYNGFFITLPAEALTVGEQEVEITYTHAYRRDGTGLHWFKDPEDGETYLFSQFEAWDFNKVFPGFDQPDLKSTYTLSVEAPAHWQVISYNREMSVRMVEQQRKLWNFPTSKRFSTYLMSIHAGPYKMWEEAEPFRTPLRIFARKKYAEFVDADEWFKVTRQGFDYFEKYFEYEFPFHKFDQVLVPEFVYGAMENVGAVTFTERLQPRREQNEVDREKMAMVVMHELAHHWFGNLVTMRWWDDIWLNESFADLMGHQATAKTTEYRNALQSFSTSRKSWGYEEDQWITTHPIVQNIPDTEAVMASIDGITYAKGAASLIQLKYLLSDHTFQKGLANYFDAYAWKNTELKDFIGTLGFTANRDLTEWTNSWLKQSGTNALQASFTCEGEQLSKLSITQKPANVSGALREHRFDILLLDKNHNRTVIDASVKKEVNNITLTERYACPIFVLPNVSDYTFARIILDESSIQFLEKSFNSFTNPIELGLIWRSLAESVHEAQLSPTRYLDLAIKYLAEADNPAMLNAQIPNIHSAYTLLEVRQTLKPQDTLAAKYREKLEALALSRYQASKDAVQRIWFKFWVGMLYSESSLEAARQYVADSTLSLDDRWMLAGALVREKDASGKTWIEKLSAQDKSAQAELNAYIASSQAPQAEAKLRWIKEAQNPQTEYAYTQLRAILNGLFPTGQHDLHLTLKHEILDPVPSLAESLTPTLLATYLGSITPIECNAEKQKVNLQLADMEKMPKTAGKILKKLSQVEARCISAQNKLDQLK
ncbi:Aminopeptidase N [Thalassocella blandensis]|nr:Aminopeptidase N [Thalassocella blandensis]